MNDIDYQDLAQRVEERVRRRKLATRWTFFGLHALMFVLAFAIALMDISGEAALPLFSFWATALFFHFMGALSDHGAMDQQYRTQAMSYALNEQLLEAAAAQKSKRSAAKLDADAVTINEEGELVPLDEDNNSQQNRRQGS